MNQGRWMKALFWNPIAVCLTGGVMFSSAASAQEPPGIYYSWRAMDMTVAQCIDQADNALASQDLNPVQTDAISIAGQSDEATAVFVCMESPGEIDYTTVMVIVASIDDDQAVTLREALKQAF
ncbi:MAG: hypothetical protein ACHWZW_21995 [Spirulina sp.]